MLIFTFIYEAKFFLKNSECTYISLVSRRETLDLRFPHSFNICVLRE